MDFLHYAERAAALVNTGPADVEELRSHLCGRAWLQEAVTPQDLTVLAEFTTALRPVFWASARGDTAAVVSGINALFTEHPVTPMISDHDPDHLHMHVQDRSHSVADLLMGEALMGLATLVCDLGATRLGVCNADSCTHVFVDTSPNRSRRYCSDRCSSRANVAAYRARQRAAAD